MDIKLTKTFLNYFPIQNSLKKHFLFYETLDKVSKRIKSDIPFICELKMNPELTLLVCNVVEELIPNKSGIDKKLLVVTILNNIFEGALTSEEISLIESQVEYDFEHKKFNKVRASRKITYNFTLFVRRFFF
jgi:hypothetical protein